MDGRHNTKKSSVNMPLGELQ